MVLGYKGFESDMTCRGFQYEVGQTYTYRQKILPWHHSIALCKRGFHFCRNVADVLNYYSTKGCRYAVVEALGKVIDGENKSVTDRIRIVRELTREELFKEMAVCEGLVPVDSPFPAAEIIKAREAGTLGEILPSGIGFPVQFSNGEWNILVVCRDMNHTYLVTKYIMAEYSAMNGSISEGGWPACGMRRHVQKIYDMLPENISKAVIPMHTIQHMQDKIMECDDMAFLLSTDNVFGEDDWYSEKKLSDTQIDIFRDHTARFKKRLGASSDSWWWLRSANINTGFDFVDADGFYYYHGAYHEGGVVVGFCIESRS